VVDLIQIPAFLCRQTDLLVEAASTGRPVNLKKGQFLSPSEILPAAQKLRDCGAGGVLITERGTTFGYNDLVVDMRSLHEIRSKGLPICLDATHSVQQPGGLGGSTGGRRELAPPLARAGAAVGLDALFLEVHDDPDRAPSDGPNMLPLELLPTLLREVVAIDRLLKGSV
jgi:2-dehydro-3-deoxyphosphooctonate aldolase (KDO 8-P synthase)